MKMQYSGLFGSEHEWINHDGMRRLEFRTRKRCADKRLSFSINIPEYLDAALVPLIDLPRVGLVGLDAITYVWIGHCYVAERHWQKSEWDNIRYYILAVVCECVCDANVTPMLDTYTISIARVSGANWALCCADAAGCAVFLCAHWVWSHVTFTTYVDVQ